MTTDAVLLYTTWPEISLVERFCEELTRDHLIACANIFSGMTSIYRWRGKIEKGQEIVALLKTVSSQVPEVEKRIRTAHPYECPCLLVIPVAGGLPDYLSWLRSQTS